MQLTHEANLFEDTGIDTPHPPHRKLHPAPAQNVKSRRRIREKSLKDVIQYGPLFLEGGRAGKKKKILNLYISKINSKLIFFFPCRTCRHQILFPGVPTPCILNSGRAAAARRRDLASAGSARPPRGSPRRRLGRSRTGLSQPDWFLHRGIITARSLAWRPLYFPEVPGARACVLIESSYIEYIDKKS